WIGKKDPKFYGGITNNLTWGAFELDFLFQFTKQKNWNYQYNGPFPGLMLNQSIDVMERWQETGDSMTQQKFTTGYNFDALLGFNRNSNSNKAISDASYIRLKTVSLVYNIPKETTKRLNCRVYLQGQNLLTFTNYLWGDPEFTTVGWLPPLRQITLGTQITF